MTMKFDYILNEKNTVFARISLGARTRLATAPTAARPVPGRRLPGEHAARSEELRLQLALRAASVDDQRVGVWAQPIRLQLQYTFSGHDEDNIGSGAPVTLSEYYGWAMRAA